MGDAGSEDFTSAYADALRRHLARPGDGGLETAFTLGRRALADGMTLLELVALHHALRTDVLESVPARLVHADDFLRDGLSSFEIAELEVWEARRAAGAERERVEILDSLSAAHLAILAVSGLRPRLEIACQRAMALVGGQRARIELGASEWGRRRVVTMGEGPGGTPSSRVPIPSRTGSGILDVWPSPGGFFGEADRAVLGQLALLASGSIDDARRLEREHTASIELQRSLLPGAMPDDEQISVAVRYLASERGNRVGGDWYDLVQLDDQCFAAVVGDVMGHGLREASLMAAMRVAFHAYAIEGVTAAAIVERVDRLFTRLAPDHLATAVLFVLDLRDHHMSVVNAGHPPPVRIDPDGHASLVEIGRSLPLGVRPQDERPDDGPVPLERGTKLLLYTDGLTERVDRSGGDADAMLLETLEGFRGSVDQLCERVLATLAPERAGDDTCVLAVAIE
jgi:serine phosphatase RsbU (regulator of sigma subunit)